VSGIAAIVPARNEAGRVGETIAAIRTIAGVDEVIVVDDASTDGTALEAEGAGARVIRLDRDLGKGGALNRGVSATDADVLLLVDADLRSSAANLAVLLPPVLAGEADVAIAAPPADGTRSGFGVVERFARWGIRRLTGSTIGRPLSGQRVLRRAVLEGAGGFAPRFGVETALTIDALRAGYRVIEVPCQISHARTGRDPAGFAHRARQGSDIALALAGRWLGRRR